MIRSTPFLTVIAMAGIMMVARPAAAQRSEASRSLTHVVSVTVPPRVKVSMTAGASSLGVSVQATQAWVLSVKPAGQKTSDVATAPADTVVASGNRSTPSPATLVFRDAKGTDTNSPVVLTVAAP